VTANKGTNIRYRLKEVETEGRLSYLLTVENVRQGQGHYIDDIVLKTDHKAQPKFKIRIKGEVNAEEIATITPHIVKLSGPAGEPLKALVKIVPVKTHSFEILEVEAKNGENICYKLDKGKTEEGLEYLLTVENLKRERGRYSDTVTLKTDNKIWPELKIEVSGVISPERFARIEPKEIILYGMKEESIKATVSITPKKENPFRILEAKAKNGRYIKCKIKESNIGEELFYTLTVENLKKEKGDYTDVIMLKTDSKVKPELGIKVLGSIFGEDQKELLNLFESLMEPKK